MRENRVHDSFMMIQMNARLPSHVLDEIHTPFWPAYFSILYWDKLPKDVSKSILASCDCIQEKFSFIQTSLYRSVQARAGHHAGTYIIPCPARATSAAESAVLIEAYRIH